MTWTQQLKHVFHIDVKTCSEADVAVLIIAKTKDPLLIEKILICLNRKATSAGTDMHPNGRVPLQAGVFVCLMGQPSFNSTV